MSCILQNIHFKLHIRKSVLKKLLVRVPRPALERPNCLSVLTSQLQEPKSGAKIVWHIRCAVRRDERCSALDAFITVVSWLKIWPSNSKSCRFESCKGLSSPLNPWSKSACSKIKLTSYTRFKLKPYSRKHIDNHQIKSRDRNMLI